MNKTIHPLRSVPLDVLVPKGASCAVDSVGKMQKILASMQLFFMQRNALIVVVSTAVAVASRDESVIALLRQCGEAADLSMDFVETGLHQAHRWG